MEPRRLLDYISVGLYLQNIGHAERIKYDLLLESFDQVKLLLEQLQLVDSLHHLVQIQPILEDDTKPHLKLSLVALKAESVWEAIQRESKDSTLLELDRTVTPRLYELPSRHTLTDSQQHLWEETIRCLERRAYRAAIVMAWALCYDVIRMSVWRDANKRVLLANKWKGRSALNAADYDEFISSTDGEHEFLENCKNDKSLLGDRPGRMHQRLVERLRERNEYAHANNKVPTLYLANAFVEHVIDIILEAPFVDKPTTI